jgi:hypothetical protein
MSRVATLPLASAWLAAYEERNADLPVAVRRLLGLFALHAKGAPQTVIDALVGHQTSVIRRDVSRRWWLVLSWSRCARHWNTFRRKGEREGVPEAWRWLVSVVSDEKRRLLLRRLGTRPWRVTTASRAKLGRAMRQQWYWYRGGTWHRDSVWAWLCITKQSLVARRPPPRFPWQHKLAPRLRALELECSMQVDLDTMTVPEVKQTLTLYVRRRMTEMLGRKTPVSWWGVAWFLATPLPDRPGFYMDYRYHQDPAKHGRPRRGRRWERGHR